MLLALFFGAVASCPLVIGAVLGASWNVPRRLGGVLLAFASGTLIAALAFDLFPVAVELTGLARSGAALLLGGAAFVVVNTRIDRRVAPIPASGEKAEQHVVVREGSRGTGLALLASVVLDGLPENLALGVSLVSEPGLGLLVAIFASNLPEALVGAASMRSGGRSRGDAVGLWTAAAALLTFAVVAGRAADALPTEAVGFLLALAGGAVIASLADTLMPEAFERGRPLNAFATAAGFFVSFTLAS